MSELNKEDLCNSLFYMVSRVEDAIARIHQNPNYKPKEDIEKSIIRDLVLGAHNLQNRFYEDLRDLSLKSPKDIEGYANNVSYTLQVFNKKVSQLENYTLDRAGALLGVAFPRVVVISKRN